MDLPPLPKRLRVHRGPRQLEDDRSRTVLQLTAWVGQMTQWPGTALHALLAQWLQTGPVAGGDPRAWLREEVPAIATELGIMVSKAAAEDEARFDQALRQAEAWQQQGWRVYGLEEGFHPPAMDSGDCCPQVLFGKGVVPSDRWQVAVFNSRKPRRFQADEPWLTALREVLSALKKLPINLVSSCGTLSYDLVSCFAQIRGVPLTFVTTGGESHEGDGAAPARGEATGGDARPEAGEEGSEPLSSFTCALQPVRCPKVLRMACRDRLLAHLAELHVVLALRGKGNLLRVLRVQQETQPRWQWILEPADKGASMGGNRLLAKKFPDWHQPLSGSSGTNSAASPSGLAVFSQKRKSQRITWDRYLYHYTRACPGPWPGQSESAYLTSVLDGESTCGHSALDTLIRILRERCIRGSHRLVRGVNAVISWTSRPPQELAAIRHWNRALGRWTFEPYGIAVNRQWLRDRGTKPAIYGAGPIFAHLPPHERFRFQVGDADRARWRREREWRLSGDLWLDPAIDALVLVPDAAAADRIAGDVNCLYRVLIL